MSFASNDYLGLSLHPAVLAAAHEALERWGCGAGSARLVVGSRPVHSQLERELAAWKGCEAALIFPTGYATNLGVLTALAGPGVRICSDALNHASIVDGCRLSRAEVQVFRHLDLDDLESRMGPGPRTIVVTEAVFSMDGDVAPIAELARLCRRAGALLVIDEAHQVIGDAPDLDGGLVLRVGTLSKTLGSLGGFVAGPASLIQLLVNRARPFIFTTAPPPAAAAAALAALRIVRSPEGESLRRRLRTLVERVKPGHPSPIVSFVMGEESAALKASRLLLELGFLVPAIRPPTVPAATSRLRLSLSAAHTDDQLDRLLPALGQLRTLRVPA